jgi:DNA polymerase III psi subunit
MIEARRRAYLDALGFDVWVARPPAAERGLIGVGAGSGSTLLICPSVADCDTDLAGDLARALGGDPVWAWLDPAGGEAGEVLENAVDNRLITRVLLFGPEPARSLFRGPIPDIVGSATITAAPGMNELAVSAESRQALWKQLRGWKAVARQGLS